MRSLLVIFVLAALLWGVVNIVAFPASKSLTVLNHMVMALGLYAALSCGGLLILERPSGRKAFALGVLTPIVCLVFGNTPFHQFLIENYYLVFREVLQVSTTELIAYTACTVVLSLANGVLTLAIFGALWPACSSKAELTTDRSEASNAPVNREVDASARG